MRAPLMNFLKLKKMGHKLSIKNTFCATINDFPIFAIRVRKAMKNSHNSFKHLAISIHPDYSIYQFWNLNWRWLSSRSMHFYFLLIFFFANTDQTNVENTKNSTVHFEIMPKTD